MVLAIKLAKDHKIAMKSLKSIRNKLFFWYATSLISVTAFFYLAVHTFTLPYRNVLFLLLLAVLALEGFFIVRKMTNGITKLSFKIKSITSKNLNEKISDITSEDEIGELADSFNQLLTRLDEAFQRESQFIGDVAHELKTPLSGLKASVELTLSRERTKEEYKEALVEALADSNRISGILKNIMDLAWSQAEGSQKGESVVDLSSVVEEIKELAIKLAFDKNIIIRSSIESKVCVLGHSDKLLRAFLNIVDNAVKFTPRKGRVTLDLCKTGDKAIFRVKDSGVGISKAELHRVFERFYRGTKTDKTFGSGLGLAIVQAIIKAHRGTINVKSKTGKGTSFIISLPLAK